MGAAKREPLGTVETRQIIVEAYRDVNGKTTCCADAENGRVCVFLRVASFGTRDVCAFTDGLLRRRKNGMGTVVPSAVCPVWRGEE